MASVEVSLNPSVRVFQSVKTSTMSKSGIIMRCYPPKPRSAKATH
jgi:hypothetical protein